MDSQNPNLNPEQKILFMSAPVITDDLNQNLNSVKDLVLNR